MTENKEILRNYWRTERLESDKKYGIRSEEAKLDTVRADRQTFLDFYARTVEFLRNGKKYVTLLVTKTPKTVK